jgi:hypothetical protein
MARGRKKAMAHLFVDLFDRVNDALPFHTLDDQDVNNRVLFHDLNLARAADKAARVRIRRGGEFRRGDHIRLLDQVRESNTDTVSVDPDIADDVNLNVVGFADKAAAVKIILNANPNGGFRLRISLFDRVGQTTPNLVFYDFEFVPHETLIDLNRFHFADKAAFVRVERGPNFRQGDRIFVSVQGVKSRRYLDAGP